MKEQKTWQEVARDWRDGQVVWTAELGGMGPGYEQAIQVLLFEIMARWGDRPVPQPINNKYPEEFIKHVDDVTKNLDKEWGFSGAQVGVAQSTAYSFMHNGYAEMMEKLPEDRKIMVSNHMTMRPV